MQLRKMDSSFFNRTAAYCLYSLFQGQNERADVHQGGEGGIWGGHVLSVVVLHLLVDLLVLLHLLPLLVRLCAAHTEGSALNSFLEKRNRLGVRPWKSCESD